MKRFRMSYCSMFFLLFAVCAVSCLSAQQPAIDKIDPPGWWAGLPSPMLLVHGENLDRAKFQVDGSGVKLQRTQSSSNGHWAFLWIATDSAVAQTLTVSATNDQGQVRKPFVLAERSHDPNAHQGFSSADVLYLLMPDRFAEGDPATGKPGIDRAAPRGWHGGDLKGIEQHIGYLHELGVTALWTTPIASNGAMPMSYHGYAATDLYAVDPHFGSIAAYQHLSAELHAHGIKLVIDLVPNHLGVEHPWVLDPPAPEWFHGTLKEHRLTKGDFLALVDPHAPEQAWRDVTGGWFTDAMPDLNQENPLVSRYLIQNAMWWVETANIDGIRLDTFPYVNRAFWRDFHAALHSAYPHLTTVGEIFNGDAEVTSFFAGGAEHQGIDTGLDTPFDFPVYFTLKEVVAHGKPMTELARVLRQDALYPHPERLVSFLGNHDTVRFLTESDGSVAKLKLALGLVLTLRGMPQIYSGDEIAMSGGADPDDRHDFPGGFPGDAHDAFTRADRTATEQEVFVWTSELAALRAMHPALRAGMEQNLFADENTFAFVRSLDAAGCAGDANDRLLVVVNNSMESKTIRLAEEKTALAGCTLFQSLAPASGAIPVPADGKLEIQVPSESMAIYEVK